MTVAPGASLEEIIEKVEPGTRPLVAVAENEDLNGVISGTDLGVVMSTGEAARLLIASDIMTTKLTTLDEQADVYTALTTFTRVEHEVLPVMSHGRGGRWVGMLTRRRVVERLHEELERSHAAAFEEHLSLRAIREDMKLDQLVMRVPGEHSDIQRLFVPIDAIGKSLRECDFRRKYNVEVIALEESDGTYQCPPDPDRPLTTKERLLAVVWSKK
jgi:signal-transduction protein with cAMP-binding, CBS, and nucleotidyltransferase domain